MEDEYRTLVQPRGRCKAFPVSARSAQPRGLCKSLHVQRALLCPASVHRCTSFTPAILVCAARRPRPFKAHLDPARPALCIVSHVSTLGCCLLLVRYCLSFQVRPRGLWVSNKKLASPVELQMMIVTSMSISAIYPARAVPLLRRPKPHKVCLPSTSSPRPIALTDGFWMQ
jgi:hypothetical protein